MEGIINKYRDANGYIKKLDDLYLELKGNNYNISDIISILNTIRISNEKILNKIKYENKIHESIKNTTKGEKTYTKKETKKETKIVNKEYIDVSYQIEFIEDNLNAENMLSILPKDNSKESILIVDTILAYYIKEINFLEYNLLFIKEDEEKKNINDDILKNRYIFDKIKEYKNSLLFVENKTSENNILFYMQNNEAYVFKDVHDNDIKISILKLIDSIKKGTFIQLRSLNNNDKLKGLFEVRDLSKRTRVIFEIKNDSYIIITSIINKTNSNSIYKDSLINDIKKYRESNSVIGLNDVRKLILGDKHE